MMTALWLGILTSINPCPLATNIAAVSFIGRRFDSVRSILLSGLFYSAGRMFTYTVLAIILVRTVFSISAISFFLQNYMNKILGPVLIVVAIFLLGLLSLPFSGYGISDAMQRRVERSGYVGAGFLGILFALSFCPASAALYFGGLIPLMISSHFSLPAGILLPSLYGIGTGLPVIVFAFLVAFGVNTVGKVFARIQQFERFARYVTGVVFIIIGIYFSLKYIFGVI